MPRRVTGAAASKDAAVQPRVFAMFRRAAVGHTLQKVRMASTFKPLGNAPTSAVTAASRIRKAMPTDFDHLPAAAAAKGGLNSAVSKAARAAAWMLKFFAIDELSKLPTSAEARVNAAAVLVEVNASEPSAAFARF